MTTSKVPSKFIPKYYPGDTCYAIAYRKDTRTKDYKNTDDWDVNFGKIFKVNVNSLHISKNGVEYWVQSIGDTNEWGESITNEDIGTLEECIKSITKRWKLK